MAVRWQIKFKSILGSDYIVDIYDNDYNGNTITELIGAASPIYTSENDDEDIYMPVRTQSGYIRIIVEDPSILLAIQPNTSTDRPVILRKGGVIMWMGFLSQERYSQQWAPSPYEIELPIISVMEAMQGVSFTQSDGYTSLFDLVTTISQYLPIPIEITAPEDTPIQDVYVQNNNFREFLTIAERTERSTTDKYECETLYECVDAFCQYFGLSLHEYGNSFYFVSLPDDIDYEDIDPQGNTQQSQWGSIDLSWFILFSSNNEQSFSPIYRRIMGIFDTGRDKAEDIYTFEAFFKQFEVEGSYSNNSELLFYGNDETWPYINGVHNAAHISSSLDSGGQIMRMKDVFIDEDSSRDSAWSDCFFVHSQKNEISASGEPAIKFYIPRKVYVNADEFAAINIDFNLSAYYNNMFVRCVSVWYRIGYIGI